VAYITDSFDNEIVRLLEQGGTGLLPTDTIYGLSCRALDQTAVEKLRKLKGRGQGKPFVILISDLKMLDSLGISRVQAEIIGPLWPSALSVVFDAPKSPGWLHRGTFTLAARMPAHRALRELIKHVGPIVSTSANLPAESPASSAEQAMQLFGDRLDFYVDAGKLDNAPSTLAAIKSNRLHVIRQGAVKIN
jgi:L-threonylcarbamoyladenylate synthase